MHLGGRSKAGVTHPGVRGGGREARLDGQRMGATHVTPPTIVRFVGRWHRLPPPREPPHERIESINACLGALSKVGSSSSAVYSSTKRRRARLSSESSYEFIFFL